MPTSLLTFTADDVPELAGGAATSDESLFDAAIWQESRGRQFKADGTPLTSKKGAIGIAQVMPDTAPEAAALAGLPYDDIKYRNDPEYNKTIGRAYFNKQRADFGDDAKALAAYNAGPNALRRALAAAEKAGQPDAWLRYLPPETQAYVPAILARRGKVSTAAAPGGAREPDYYTPDRTRYAEMPSPIPDRSTFEAVADAALALGSGLSSGVGMVASVAGADNAVARATNDLSQTLDDMQSPARKAQREARAETIRQAEESGSTWEEIKAYAGALLEAPADTILNAVGSTAPTLLTVLIPGLSEAAVARLVVQGAVGAAQGAGAVKGAIYQQVEQKLVEAGVNPEDAKKTAAAAQAYDSQNGGNIAVGALLGVLAGTTGAESAVARILGGKVAQGVEQGVVKRTAIGVAKESPTEAVQGGQERASSNIALQNEGFDVPTMQGVAGQATLEGMAAAPLGGVTGALERPHAPAPAVPPGLEKVAEKAAEGNSPLSKAAIAGNTGPLAQAAAAQAQAQQQAVEAEAAKPDPLTARAAEIAATLRQKSALDALRAENSPVKVQAVLKDLAIAQSPSTAPAAREQAIGRLEYALEWAGVNPAAQVASGIEEIVGGATEGRAVPEVISDPYIPKLQAGADRDAQLQQQKNEATTAFDKQQTEEQARINRERAFGAEATQREPVVQKAIDFLAEWDRGNRAHPVTVMTRATDLGLSVTKNDPMPQVVEKIRAAVKAAEVTPKAAPPAAAPRQPTTLEQQSRIETAAGVGRRRAEVGPQRQELIAIAMRNIEDRNGVAAPWEAELLREAGMGEPWDRIDNGLSDVVLTEEAQSRLVTAAKQGVGAKPSRTPEQRALEAAAAEGRKKAAGERLDDADMRLEKAAALGERRQQAKAGDIQIAKSEARAAEPAPAAAVPKTGSNAPKVGTDLKTPAVFRKRRATLRQLIENGLTQVEKRGGAWVLTDGRKSFVLEGPADAQLARAERQRWIDARANAAATSPLNGRKEPTGPQIEAVNWKKGDPIKLAPGVVFIVENPKGSVRKSKPGAKKPWQIEMKHHYGDIAGTKGADGDPIDVFYVGDGNRIFVIDQVNPDGAFDEHKVMYDVRDEKSAREAYLSNYEKGWTGLGAITEMSLDEFRSWKNDEEATNRPVGKIDGKSGSADNAAAGARNGAGRADAAGGVADGSARGGQPAGLQPADDPSAGSAAGNGAAAPVRDGGKRSHVTARVNGKKRQIPVVPIEELSTDSPARAGGKKVISQENAELIKAIAGVFGKEVVLFEDRDGDLGDGFVLPQIDSALFLNQETSIQPLAVFGHELLHLMAREMPKAHAALRATVLQRLKADGAKGFREDYYHADGQPKTNETLNSDELEELTSDLGGNLMSDPAFWREVMDKVAQDHPGEAKTIIAQLAAKLYALVDKLIAALRAIRQPGFRADKFVDDIEGIRTAYRDALAKYIAEKNIRKPAMQAEILRQGKQQQAVVRQSAGREKADNTADERAEENSAGELGQEPGRAAAQVPEYGTPREGAVSVLARHYGTEARKELSSAAYGRGYKGGERDRVMEADDKRLRDRIYFYVDQGKGIQPEAGVGPHAHEVRLNNIYDPRTRLVKSTGGNSAFESAVLNAGFDGYLNPEFTTRQGAVVLLGKHNVPVKHIGMPAAPKGDVEPRAAKPVEAKLLEQRLSAAQLAKIDLSKIPGAWVVAGTLRAPLESRAQAEAEIERAGAEPKFSTARDVTKTPEFQKWFEGSKVVDADGRPLVLLHGTRGDFSEFDQGRFATTDEGTTGAGIYATTDKDFANAYTVDGKDNGDGGNVMPLYMAVKNPVDFDTATRMRQEIVEEMVAKGTPEFKAEQLSGKALTMRLMRMGYDGVEPGFDGAWVAFDPGQVKSALGNSGAFDGGNSDITQSTKRKITETPEFKKWFGDSAVVDDAGDPLVVYHGTASAFEKFDGSRLGKSTRNPSAHLGFFFSASADDADAFAIGAGENGRLSRDGANIVPAYLSIRNPYEMSAGEFGDLTVRQATMPSTVRRLRAQLEAEGHDGVVIRADEESDLEELQNSDTWVAFKPEQIKSAIGNSGDFSADDADITQSAKREYMREEVVEAAGSAFRFLTPAERAKLRVDTATKLYDLFSQMPSANEMAAVAWAGKAKRGWYEQSAQALMHVFGPDAPRFAALLAAMSPQTSVEVNLRNALSTWKNWVRAGRPVDKSEIFQIMGRSVEGNKLTDSVLPAWVPNSVRALTAEDPESVVLSGPKVNSFMLNLRGVTEEVTNDAWMANYAAVDQRIFSGSLNVAGTDPGKTPGYMAMSARVRQAARKLTDLTGEDWTPAEVQETIWSWAKTLYELQDKDTGARELLENEAVTDELIQSTPDFRTQLHEERNEETLREAGYGEEIDSLRGRGRDAGPGAEGSEARGQAAPFDRDAQGKLLRKAAARLEELKRSRDQAEARTRELNAADVDEDVKASAARILDEELDAGLEGLPRYIEIPGHGVVIAGRLPQAMHVARQYMAAAGMKYTPPKKYVKVDQARAKRIAQAYEDMQHAPNDPKVKAAYDALTREVKAQYKAVIDSGLQVEFIDTTQPDPYAASPRLVTEDVRRNNHMWVFSTRDGFGSGDFDPAQNPLLAETQFEISGQKALVNDLFRVVHDYFGHVKEGLGFRADGEENAWRAHWPMFSPLARKALTTETRGQNSYVNFGPHGEKNRKASAADTIYADQKTGLLPDWVVNDGATDAPVRDDALVQLRKDASVLKSLLNCLAS